MSDQRACRKIIRDQKGIALAVTLLALVLLLALALGMVQTSVGSLRTAGNDRATKVALAIAEGGAEYARESLRVQLKGGALNSLNQALQRAATPPNGSTPGTLVNATLRSAFNGTTGSTNNTLNSPLIGPTSFRGGQFQVFLSNDRKEPGAVSQAASVESQTDTNNKIMITAFANGPGGAVAAVQEQLQVFNEFLPGPTLPGVIVLPGPTVNFQTFSSNARQVSGVSSSGGCYPTVSVSTNAALTVVNNGIDAKRPNNYQSCSPFTGIATENFLPPASNPYDSVSPNTPLLVGDSRLVQVNYWQNLVNAVSAVADFHSTSDPGFTLGTTSSPKIVALSGNVSFSGNVTGSGILLVTGTLTFSGTPTYNGLILVVGQGSFVYNGNGHGGIYGALAVVNTNTPWSGNSNYVGIPTYTDNGGGNSTEEYDSSSVSKYAAAIMPLQLLSFQELR